MGFSRQEYWSGVPLPSPALFPITLLLDSLTVVKLPATYSEKYSLYFKYCPLFFLHPCTSSLQVKILSSVTKISLNFSFLEDFFFFNLFVSL